MTFLDITSFDIKSNITFGTFPWYLPLVPFLYPKKTHFLALGSSLDLSFSRLKIKQRLPKTFRSVKSSVLL